MTFIITLISLVIERFFHWTHWRQWHWFTVYQRWLSHSRLSRLPAILLLVLSLLPLVVVVGVINSLLGDWLYGILKIVFGIAVLLYCMGPINMWFQVYRSIAQLHKEDDINAVIERIRNEFSMGSVEKPELFHQTFVRAIFLAAYQGIFAVVFWFVVLGPVGAVLYRSIALMSVESPLGLMQLTKKIKELADWVPVRILTFLFALGGHFTQVFACWKQMVFSGPALNEKILSNCGIAALDNVNEDMAEKETIDLLDRTFIIGLVLLAVVVLIL